MSKNKKTGREAKVEVPTLNLSGESLGDDAIALDAIGDKRPPMIRRWSSYLTTHWLRFGSVLLVLLLGIGVMAKNGWFPSTDPFSGNKTGWFGKELPKNAASIWNPLAPPPPPPTTSLSKEYIYAGSRLLAVEDANANAAPPADLAVWRKSTGVWYVLGGPGSTYTEFGWGNSTDIPAQGDFDGDGKTDFSVFRPSEGNWYVFYSSTSTYAVINYGTNGDKPVMADFDGDGKTDLVLYRPSTSVWYFKYSSTGAYYSLQYGLSSDVPAAADYDGDGRADIGVWRPSTHTFYSTNSSNGQIVQTSFGSTGDTPVCADYDGDGKANYAVRSGASWIVMNAALTAPTTTTPPGDIPSDIPVPNDYDGDGKVDIAVWHDANGFWSIRQSSNGQPRYVQFGSSGDIPVPAYYRR